MSMRMCMHVPLCWYMHVSKKHARQILYESAYAGMCTFVCVCGWVRVHVHAYVSVCVAICMCIIMDKCKGFKCSHACI